MGADYDAEYGIGYEVLTFPETWKGEEDYEIYEFLNSILKDTKYSYIQWGDEGYSGDPDTYAVVFMEEPSPADLSHELIELQKFLNKQGVEYKKDSYCVGGLMVC